MRAGRPHAAALAVLLARRVGWPFIAFVVSLGCRPRAATNPPAAPGASVSAPAAAAPPSVSSTSAPAEAPAAGVCARAFSDQRQLYVDAEIAVHPDREATFIELCERSSPTLQRCASPLYQVDHMDECEHARSAASAAESEAWHRMFDALSGDVTRPMGREPAR